MSFFGFGAKKASPAPASGARRAASGASAAGLDLGIDDLLAGIPGGGKRGGAMASVDDDDLGHIDVTEEDMNDPELLRELEALAGPSQPKAAPRQAAAPPKVQAMPLQQQRPVAATSSAATKPSPAKPNVAAASMKKPATTSSAVAHPSDLDLDALTKDAFDDHHVENIEVTEEDMTDPDLLAELYELDPGARALHEPNDKAPTSSKKPTGPTKPNPAVHHDLMDFDDHQHQDENDDHGDVVPVVASVHRDSHLVDVEDAPSKNRGTSNHMSHKIIDEVEDDCAPMQAESSAPEDELPLEYKLKSTDVNVLQKYVQLSKVQAVMASKAGDKAKAREYLLASKQLETRLQQVSSSSSTKTPAASATGASAPAPVIKKNASPATPSSSAPAATASVAKTATVAVVNDAVEKSSSSPARSTSSTTATAPVSKTLSNASTTSVSSTSSSSTTSSSSPSSLNKNGVDTAAAIAAIKAKSAEQRKKASAAMDAEDTDTASIALDAAKRLLALTQIWEADPTKIPTTWQKDINAAALGTSVVSQQHSTASVSSTSSSPTHTTAPSSGQRSSSIGSRASVDDTAEFDKIKEALKSQIAICLKMSQRLLTSGKKAEALGYHKEKQAMEKDLETLQSAQMHGQLPPPFTYVDRIVTQNIAFPELQPNDLEVHIGKCTTINPQLAGVSSEDQIEVYVQWKIEYPSAEQPQSGVTGSIKKSYNPDFDHTIKLNVERNRNLMRVVEKKRMVFELFQAKGWLWKGAVSIGKALVPLSDLVNKCEVDGNFELVNEHRKALGIRLDVRIRMQRPLMTEEYRTSTEKWLVLNPTPVSLANAAHPVGTLRTAAHPNAVPSSVSVPSAANPALNVPASSATAGRSPVTKQTSLAVPAAASGSGSSSAASSPIIAPKSPATAAAKQAVTPATSTSGASPKAPSASALSAASANNDDDDEIEYNTVEEIASNMVLEHEMKLVTKTIDELKAKKQPIPEELEDRRQTLDIKMNLLVLQVQTGKLSMEAYIASIKNKIGESKKKALEAKQNGKIEAAKRYLTWLKLMQDEVDEVENASG